MKMRKLPGRITKAAARTLWKQSKPFVVVPANLRPYNVDGTLAESAYLVTADSITCYASFDEFCEAYVYFNCNLVVGRYPAFYIKLTERNM